jgi:hypothetical protein
VICGLQGKPLTPEAVTLAAQVDDAMRTARAQIRAARGNGDLDRAGASYARSTAVSLGKLHLPSPAKLPMR